MTIAAASEAINSESSEKELQVELIDNDDIVAKKDKCLTARQSIQNPPRPSNASKRVTKNQNIAGRWHLQKRSNL